MTARLANHSPHELLRNEPEVEWQPLFRANLWQQGHNSDRFVWMGGKRLRRGQHFRLFEGLGNGADPAQGAAGEADRVPVCCRRSADYEIGIFVARTMARLERALHGSNAGH